MTLVNITLDANFLIAIVSLLVMAKAKRKTNKKTCSTAGRNLKKHRSSSAGKHLGGPCKSRAKGTKKK
jgi:hypothetical protein